MGNDASDLCCLSSQYRYGNGTVPSKHNLPTGGEYDHYCHQKQQQSNVTPLRNNIISSQDCSHYNHRQGNADAYQSRDRPSGRVVTPPPPPQLYGYGTPEPLLVTLTPNLFLFASTPPPRSDPPSKIVDSSNFSISSISADSTCDFSIKNNDPKITYLTLDEMRNDEARRQSLTSNQDERINATMSGSAANSVGGDDRTTFTNTNMFPFNNNNDATIADNNHRNARARGSGTNFWGADALLAQYHRR